MAQENNNYFRKDEDGLWKCHIGKYGVISCTLIEPSESWYETHSGENSPIPTYDLRADIDFLKAEIERLDKSKKDKDKEDKK